jgi:hypothetical protein
VYSTESRILRKLAGTDRARILNELEKELKG